MDILINFEHIRFNGYYQSMYVIAYIIKNVRSTQLFDIILISAKAQAKWALNTISFQVFPDSFDNLLTLLRHW